MYQLKKFKSIILSNVFQTSRVTCKAIPTDPTPLYDRMEELLFHMSHTNTHSSNSKKGPIWKRSSQSMNSNKTELRSIWFSWDKKPIMMEHLQTQAKNLFISLKNRMTLLKHNLAARNVHIKPRIFHSAQFSDSWALNLMEGGCVSLSAQDLLQYKINRALDANNHDQNHHLRLPQSSDRTEVISSKQSLYNIRIMLNSVCPRAMKNVLRLYHTGKGWDTDIWRQSTIIQKQINGYMKLAFSNFQIKKITGHICTFPIEKAMNWNFSQSIWKSSSLIKWKWENLKYCLQPKPALLLLWDFSPITPRWFKTGIKDPFWLYSKYFYSSSLKFTYWAFSPFWWAPQNNNMVYFSKDVFSDDKTVQGCLELILRQLIHVKYLIFSYI